MKGRLIIFLLLFLFTQSCGKNDIVLIRPNSDAKSFNEIFETFWNQMNRNYVYWDIDATNWNSVYNQYKPLFNQLNVADWADLHKSVQYFKEMTSGLIDGHYQITFKVPALSDSIINPAVSRKLRDANFHNPISYFSLAEKKLDPDFVKGFDYSNNQGSGPLFAMSGKIKKTILYFGFSEFSLFRSYNSNTDNDVKQVIQYFFNNLAKNDSLKAVILDIRNNPGGDFTDLNFLVGRFISRPLQIGYFHTKRGDNPLDFTPWISVDLQPAINSLKKNLSFIILADNYSASLSEIVVMSARLLPGATVMGETTYGATGPITGSAVYNAGSFDVGNFLSVQTSSTAFKYIDKQCYERKGFPPDVSIPFNKDSIGLGIDAVLNQAIRYVQ